MQAFLMFFAVLGAAVSVALLLLGPVLGLLALPGQLLMAIALLALAIPFFGLVVIGESEVGVVVKKFGRQSLPSGRLVALEGEAGYQADTLPPGWHFGYWLFMYEVTKAPFVVVPQGEVALVLASDGDAIPPGRILAHVVDCDHYQDARLFLKSGGEKGRQLGILTAGTYRINTALFTVITAARAAEHGMDPRHLAVHAVEPDLVGIVTGNGAGVGLAEGLLGTLLRPSAGGSVPKQS